ncbi:TetR/AcrR family transcriptional regulator C-terminal domain-containing protein [Streptomyces sp. AV19]|uniref:TetR/AcrR family transcriptional regulator n=1 Tax=Streptomyces sp. AV19 TaxID=2793068 RepID=UPI0018FE512D|nr:TetR/AcrR family transcriptional regulator C-terminal domain-containing protein [Streptomyces sp. AV19]MBH1937906.1 TetR/AcrR family transcriptional regulator C-terminal domain-containing protein [Streptomyces sp. AV19]MDG4536543.1 TetR/AcrR family transcriptional regulator C-terminal domain-containing protein [Streptomyces sp. AV19]
MNPRGPGRPRTLSRALIVGEARRIADEEGLGSLTVRRVAQRLGTGQASLYRHITDRGELLGLLADDVAARLPRPAEDGDARERVTEHWLAAHDHLLRHPWAARIIADGEHLAHGAADFTDAALGALEAAGLSPDDAVRAYRALWNLLLGHVLNAHPVGHTRTPRRAAGDARSDFSWALSRMLDGVLGAGGLSR